MAAGLVPLITSRHNIKRRIIMITEFKHTGGIARCLFALLFVALGGPTFTRAADDTKPAATNTGLPSSAGATRPPDTSNATGPDADHGDPSFLASQYKIIDAATPPPKSAPDYGPEYVRESTLLEQLKSMQRNEPARFIQALSATTSDPILNSLLELQLAQQTRLASLRRHEDTPAPQMQEAEAVINDIKQKMDNRANGIIDGMSLKVAALKAAANDGLRRVPASDNALSKRLEDWDHQRVIAEADYLEYSNILFNLETMDPKLLGGALTGAYAHESDHELLDLASRLETAKANMTATAQTYGPEMPIYKTAAKQLEQSQAAYQNKIDAVMAGIKTRVNEDKGLLQLIEREEKKIEENRRKQEDERRY
jgi:hypothetical protein